jgi:Skp family chaperone for outer membrane proteins
VRFLRSFVYSVAVLIWAATSAFAQSASDLPRIVTSPILVIQSDRLFSESEFGQRVARDRAAAEAALEEENQRVATELEEEERVLTEQRKTMPSADFRAAADAFDAKAQAAREAQISKQREISQTAENERLRFLRSLNPVLEQILAESNALIILERRTAFAVRDVLDVTDRALFQANRILGDGTETPEQ